MIRLFLLGGIDLRGPDGRELRAVLAQPKRLALLAYLAAHAGEPPLRRDVLLAAFWPDLDQPHARNALSKAVHFLRRALGDDAVVSRTADELAVDESVIWSDVRAFATALGDERLIDALALYRGDLLPGFFVPGAAGFEEWAERERSALRSRAAEAARRQAATSEVELDFVSAARYARLAAELSPNDERALRRLIRLLDRSGDRAGALHAYAEFARRLATEYETEPAAETKALVAAVRAGRVHTVAAREETDASEVRPPELRGHGPTRAASSRVEAGARRGGRVTRRIFAAALGLALVIAAASIVRRADPAPSPTAVAVLPFTVHGSDELAYLGEGMVDLLSVNLDDAADLRSVDPRRMLSFVKRREGDVRDVGASATRWMVAGSPGGGDPGSRGPGCSAHDTVLRALDARGGARSARTDP